LRLRDANLLYRSGSYASAVVLAAFAREELGKWKILLELRREVLGGKTVGIDEVKDRCDDHAGKQKAGMLGITMRGDRSSGLGTLLSSRMEASPGSDKRKEADDQLAKIDRLKEKRVPDDRHEQRMSALYVDPVSVVVGWNRPAAAVSRTSAYEFLIDARDDYSLQQCDHYTNLEILKSVDPELSDALEQWIDRPKLPLAEILTSV